MNTSSTNSPSQARLALRQTHLKSMRLISQEASYKKIWYFRAAQT